MHVTQSEAGALTPRPSAFAGIDEGVARRLLGLALSRGGDYADLYFEHAESASYVYEDERVKTVGRGITLGMGVRVLKGEATGYAYCEGLDEAALSEAARTAAQIAQGERSPGPVQITARHHPDFYPVPRISLDTAPQAKLELLRRADRAARAVSPRVVKVTCNFSEEHREILLFTDAGDEAAVGRDVDHLAVGRWLRDERAGLRVDRQPEIVDAGHGFFGSLGDSVVTGPTRTNVNDFRVTLIAP